MESEINERSLYFTLNRFTKQVTGEINKEFIQGSRERQMAKLYKVTLWPCFN